MSIPIGVFGKILDPETKTPFVLVEDDTKGKTGGIYIFVYSDREKTRGFDYWVLPEELDGFFDGQGWKVVWDGT